MAEFNDILKNSIKKLESLYKQLTDRAHKIQFEINNGKATSEVIDLVEVSGNLRDRITELTFLRDGIESAQKGLESGDVGDREDIVKKRLENDLKAAKNKLKTVARLEKSAESALQRNPAIIQATKEKKEEPEDPPTSKKTEASNKEYDKILKATDDAIEKFNKKIPASQKAMFEALEEELRRLDLSGKNIKASVKNLKIIASIKAKLTRLILSPEYIESVKEFAKSFNEITTLQNEYWKGLESTFKPRPLLREIRKAAIGDTVKALTEGGISANITTAISDILKTNITGGGSYKALTAQLKESLLNTKTDGLLSKYAKTITVDALSTYSRTYNDTVSSDLGFTFYAYSGTEILSSREMCQSLIENHRYFHVSSITNLLKGIDEQGNPLKFTDNITKDVKSVRINPRNNLPYGFKDGTNESNFIIRASGWNCPHVCRAVPERNVKMQDKALYEMIISSPPYIRWKKLNPVKSKFDI